MCVCIYVNNVDGTSIPLKRCKAANARNLKLFKCRNFTFDIQQRGPSKRCIIYRALYGVCVLRMLHCAGVSVSFLFSTVRKHIYIIHIRMWTTGSWHENRNSDLGFHTSFTYLNITLLNINVCIYFVVFVFVFFYARVLPVFWNEGTTSS